MAELTKEHKEKIIEIRDNFLEDLNDFKSYESNLKYFIQMKKNFPKLCVKIREVRKKFSFEDLDKARKEIGDRYNDENGEKTNFKEMLEELENNEKTNFLFYFFEKIIKNINSYDKRAKTKIIGGFLGKTDLESIFSFIECIEAHKFYEIKKLITDGKLFGIKKIGFEIYGFYHLENSSVFINNKKVDDFFKKELEVEFDDDPNLYNHYKSTLFEDETIDLRKLEKKIRDEVMKNDNEEIDTYFYLTRNLIADCLIYLSSQNSDEEKNNFDKEIQNLLNKKNQIILYGPAGTGKTFSTKKIIFNHLNNKLDLFDEKNRGEFKNNFEDLKKNKQVEFITFHQSFAYEEFIEGIKPNLENEEEGEIKYKIENGIFKDICERAILEQIKNTDVLEKQKEEVGGFEERYKKLLEKIGEQKEDKLELETKTKKIFGISINSQKSLNLLTGKELKKQGSLTKENILKEYEGEKKPNFYRPYWKSIIEEMRKQEKPSEKNLNYEDKNIKKSLLEKFYNLNNKDKKKIFENLKPYYLIIDEINRGNISKIFGELITLLEKDKRLGEKNELTAKLPYLKKDFGIPPNLFIIGTMNTSDKSIANLDIALRRRFGFVEMLPKYDLKEITENNNNILKELNKRIKILIDKDHQIGHSFFIGEKEKNYQVDLEFIFRYEIVPLLEEYFYNDYEKIQLVLGNKNLEKINTEELGENKKDFYKYWFEIENKGFDIKLGNEGKKNK